MERGLTGRYIVTSWESEEVRAFVPAPLPPDPPLQIDGALLTALEEANVALGRLDGAARLLPDPALFIFSYVRKEAVLSSQIEGTQSSLSDLMRFELIDTPGLLRDDAAAVSRYVVALNHVTTEMANPAGLPLCNRLLREAHRILVSGGRGGDKQPGEFRRSQNWIGGTRPGNAAFVPPPQIEAGEAMSDLERFVHSRDDGIPTLVRAGLAHVQFETIHPFLDGNGRIGRMLVVLMMMDRGVLTMPVLYLSLFLKRHRDDYYRLLDQVRQKGDWEAWLEFFLDGVRYTATAALDTAQRIERLVARDRESVATMGRAAGSALRVHEALAQRVAVDVAAAVEMTGLSAPTVGAALNRLCEFGVASEITGQRRNRVFAYDEYLALLNEDTDPL